jgi:hypothetical protein
MNINYDLIESIDDYCISILMLQVYYYFTGFNPILQSLDDITSEIDTLNMQNSSLNDTIKIRNYYSEIINTFIDIEYLSPNATSFILDYYSVRIIDKFGLIYDLKKWYEINYHILLFIYENLNIIHNEKNTFIDDNDSTNFAIITTLYNFLNTTDLTAMNIYNSLSDNRKKVESNESFESEEERENLEEYLYSCESYKYLSLFLIKYCNELAKKLCKNKLTFSDNGILFDYNEITNNLDENDSIELLDTFQNLQINISSNNEIQNVLKKLLSFDKFDDYHVVIQNFENELKILENTDKLNTQSNYHQDSKNQNNKVIGAGITFKNKINKKRNKTKKSKNIEKKINKKGTKKRKNGKRKKFTKKI